MKKIYLSPVTETVNVKLFGSVMDEGIDIINNSTDVSDEGLGKENNLLFEDDAFGDIWGDTDNSSNPYDMWGEN
ncbi:MAG: hypothetical protein J6T43_04550 [Prevotella sp.]|jgi:hypothetical protein|nr:hypothetical protein [Prevotella sp.]